MTPEEFTAALAGMDNTIAGKGQFYNQMLGSGLSDAELRALVDSTIGLQSDSDWNYLQQIAQVQNTAKSESPLNKAELYNSFQDVGYEDPYIRDVVSNAVGPQTNEDWNWLKSVDSVLDIPKDATAQDKAEVYNSLQQNGYNDADIRNIVQDAVGPQKDAAWSYLTDAAKSLKFEASPPGESNGGWKDRQIVGGSDKSLMGAGNANYNSSLIKSLRQASLSPFSTNPGVMLASSQGTTPSEFTTPPESGGAFNPQAFTPRTASQQEVSDWNAYNAYRTNALNSKTPILSLSEWLAVDKSNGMPKQEEQKAASFDPTTVNWSGA